MFETSKLGLRKRRDRQKRRKGRANDDKGEERGKGAGARR